MKKSQQTIEKKIKGMGALPDKKEIWRSSLRYNRQRIHAALGYLTPTEYELGADAQKLKFIRHAA